MREREPPTDRPNPQAGGLGDVERQSGSRQPEGRRHMNGKVAGLFPPGWVSPLGVFLLKGGASEGGIPKGGNQGGGNRLAGAACRVP